MNKTIIGVIIAVILLGGGWWLMSNNQPAEQNSQVNEENTESATMKSSLTSLLKLGRNMTCTYRYSAEEGEQSGTIYIAGNKMSGDFNMMADGKPFVGHMIQDGEWSYTWGGPMSEKQGVKIKLSEIEDKQSGDVPEQSSIDPDVEYDYDCDNWSPDNDKFTPPADVVFQDLSQLIPSLPTKETNDNSQCAVCDQVPAGEAQEQCRQALGC